MGVGAYGHTPLRDKMETSAETPTEKRIKKLAKVSRALGIWGLIGWAIAAVGGFLLFITMLDSSETVPYETRMVLFYLFCVYIFLWLCTQVLALVFGVVAIRKMKQANILEARNQATTGIICGSIFIGFGLLVGLEQLIHTIISRF